MTKVEVDKARLLRRVIIISWASLAICFVIKIFGGNFFEIMCENPNYKALCEYADSHFWCKYLICFASSIFCQYFFLLSIIQEYKFNKKQWVVTLLSVIICCFIKLLGYNFAFVADIWLSILLPIIFAWKRQNKFLVVLIANIFNIGFQFISLVTKNISIGIIDNSTLVSLIYSIDVYIMCVLYYLYRNFNKEKKQMGAFWTWFMGKPIDKLKAMKAKREEKIAKLEKEVNAIEIEIERQKKNEK